MPRRVRLTISPILCAWLAGVMCASVRAQSAAWQPSPGHTQLPIWPAAPPDEQPVSGQEVAATAGTLVAGQPRTHVVDVSQPTMTVYSPSGTNTGAAVVVFPGGGYQNLAIDLEGTEVCDWLTSKGITCVLLKYRVPHSGPYWDADLKRHVNPQPWTALEDAQRTLGLVRFHAGQWQVDPHKVGVLGFSMKRTSTWIRTFRSPDGHRPPFSCRPKTTRSTVSITRWSTTWR